MANISRTKVAGKGEQTTKVAAWNSTHHSINIVKSSDAACVFTIQVKFAGGTTFAKADKANSDLKLNESATFLLPDVEEVKIVPSVATANYEARVNSW